MDTIFSVPGASALIDVTAPDSYDTVLSDLEYGVNLAEKEQVDLFMSIHFDKCYDSYEGALGTACWILGTGGEAEKIGSRVCKSVSDVTGLVNR